MDFGIKAARAALLVGVLGLLVSGAYAQDQATEDAAELGDITVTGSRIRRPAVEGPTPVVVITREDIANQGFGSIQDVFDSVVQNTSGSVAQTQTFGFTPATSSPRLRGFSSGFTLAGVLLAGSFFVQGDLQPERAELLWFHGRVHTGPNR